MGVCTSIHACGFKAALKERPAGHLMVVSVFQLLSVTVLFVWLVLGSAEV